MDPRTTRHLNRATLIYVILGLVWCGMSAASPSRAAADPLFPSYNAFKAELTRVTSLTDPAERAAEVDALWTVLRDAGQVPYREGTQVAMLYRGTASSVAFPGDAGGWSGNTSWRANRLGDSDLWLYEASIPSDARVDYKVLLNGSDWRLDPANPHQQWSGFGPNSELRMPRYVFPQETLRDPAVPRGTLRPNLRLTSANLRQDVNVRVYTPAGYDDDALANLPVVYVTDGHEYADDRLGAMVTVLDNLIARGDLQPTLAVFIDPRDPATGANRRMEHYATTQRAGFADFVATELVPRIDADFRTRPDPQARVILGTSLGGLFAAYLGTRHPEAVANLAIQSPAFWVDPSIYTAYANQAPTLRDALRVYIESGAIGDGNGGPTMADVLNRYGYDYAFEQVNQGHSWGHWKGQLDNALIRLIGPTPIPEPAACGALIGVPLLAARAATRRRAGPDIRSKLSMCSGPGGSASFRTINSSVG